MVKATAVQGAMGQGIQPQSDPNIDLILQSLMIDDTDVKRILKGEIHEPLNRFRQCVAELVDLNLTCFKIQTIDSTQGQQILGVVREIYPLMSKIEVQLKRYYHMVPYLLMLSPLVRLSNIDAKTVSNFCDLVDLMILRDKAMSSWSDANYESENFYTAISILMKLALHESEEGWKARVVTEEKKQVITEIRDKTSMQRKKRFGLF